MVDPLDTGALVGWQANDLGSRMVLRLQTMHRTEENERELGESAVLLDRNQAVPRADYLYEITDEPRPKRYSLLQMLFAN
jgi:hypothetical protein